MTPAARVATAIGVLDEILAGVPAEKSLTAWARQSRYAGSGDRAAIRDLVFDALRCRRSYGWLGGAETGRGQMIGALRAAGADLDAIFSGSQYAPDSLDEDERHARDLSAAPRAVAWDVPDWLLGPLAASLGADLAAVLQLLQKRAPVFLRTNLARTSREAAAACLREDGIDSASHDLSGSALLVLSRPRKIQTSKAFLEGLVELQDAASQAVVDRLDLADGMRALDYCAGGGGKALAIAARADVHVFAHDANPARMRDLPARAARADVAIPCLDTAQTHTAAPYDLVLCDAPCSGSGAWRRSPDAKWRLTPDRLDVLRATQAEILDQAATLVGADGVLAYATCSLLDSENRDQIAAFLARTPGWTLTQSHRFSPLDGGDGFYIAQLKRLTTRPLRVSLAALTRR